MGHPSRTDNHGWEFKLPSELTDSIWTTLKFSRPSGAIAKQLQDGRRKLNSGHLRRGALGETMLAAFWS